MRHGDGLFLGHVVVDDDSRGVERGRSQDLLLEGAVSSMQQCNPVLGIGRDKEASLTVTTQTVCNFKKTKHDK